MIKAIIIDDEKNAREFLSKLILRYFPKKIIVLDTCNSVSSGVDAIKLHDPELVFLDIQMPNENGFGLFKYFDSVNFEVIFTTAYKEYAIDAIKHAAFDYLLKPIVYIDLLSTIKRFEQRKDSLQQQERITLLLENITSNDTYYNKVALPTEKGYEMVKLNTILYCKSDSNYCKIFCADGTEFLLAKTLKYVEELLNSDLFIRTHKSYLVNLNYVVKFDKIDELKVTLTNGEQLPVSFRKKESFLNALLKKK